MALTEPRPGGLDGAIRWLRLATARRAVLREWKRGTTLGVAAIRQRRLARWTGG